MQSVTAANWDSEVLQSKGLVVVNFYAVWSGPSQQLDTTINELANEYAGKVKMIKLNADENTKVASKYQIKGIPTLIFFKGGQKVDQIVGAAQKPIIKAKIDFHL
ncbi:MAG: thioredoxin [Nitrospirae bacterium]|nr:thioredoxin [Nitrospirota bacterium]